MATRIVCRAIDCIFNEDKLCTSDEIVYDLEEGCLTYEVLDDLVDLEFDEDDEEWEEDEIFENDNDDLFPEDEDDDELRLV
jgi:hypothetical protein